MLPKSLKQELKELKEAEVKKRLSESEQKVGKQKSNKK